ncbi:hypothetical protein Pmani_005743 [Petrolisthes manimaculis]|uniref:Uncharacterized protein n=1 Tax=Petrolisthes manimaculis TaxID=1843537 RepID=A0AAE1ULX5_9EUCA|nr:hypothetical protein Pmani_005743 [Petrolisthes manimaculis]
MQPPSILLKPPPQLLKPPFPPLNPPITPLTTPILSVKPLTKLLKPPLTPLMPPTQLLKPPFPPLKPRSCGHLPPAGGQSSTTASEKQTHATSIFRLPDHRFGRLVSGDLRCYGSWQRAAHEVPEPVLTLMVEQHMCQPTNLAASHHVPPSFSLAADDNELFCHRPLLIHVFTLPSSLTRRIDSSISQGSWGQTRSSRDQRLLSNPPQR